MDRKSYDHILTPEKDLDSKEKMDPELVDRAVNDGKLATEVRSFLENGKSLEKRERKNVAGILERRFWGHILLDLEEGDTILSALMPGADFLTIKYLNDKLLGETDANRIIRKRRIFLQSKFNEKISNVSFLVTEYNKEIVKIPVDKEKEIVKVPVDAEIDKKIFEEIMAEVNVEMTRFIKEEVIKPLIEKYKKEGNGVKQKELELFLTKLEGSDDVSVGGKHGFRMNYGLAVVKNDKVPGDEGYDKYNYEGKMTALSQSLQTSEMARVSNDKYGATHDESKTVEEINEIHALRSQIFLLGNSIKDSRGNKIKIFFKVKDEEGERLVFNESLLTKIRADGFKVLDSLKDKKLMQMIIFYIKKLNVFDMIKPFRDENRGAVVVEANKAKVLAKKIRDGVSLSDEEKEDCERMLFADERAPQFTSRMEFSKRAMAMKKASYISLDVKGLGSDLRLEFEKLSQICIQEKDPIKRKKLIKEKCLSAGDETTLKLVAFWDAVHGVLRKRDYGLVKEGELITGLVGGDELLLAVEIGEGEGKIPEKKLGELLFALKNATNARVVESRVAASTKDVAESVTDERVLAEEHLLAKKKNEACTVVLKDMELAARYLSDLLNEENGEEKVREILDDLDGLAGLLFTKREKEIETNVVVRANEDKKGEFDVFYNDNESFEYSKIKEFIDKLLGK